MSKSPAPVGLTSFDSLAAVKRCIGSGKAGHTGTLDKFAEGLLLVLTGRALKLSRWFTGCDKHYEGTIRFLTDWLDGAAIAGPTAWTTAVTRSPLSDRWTISGKRP